MITQDRDRIAAGWYKESTTEKNADRLETEYFAASETDCRGLAAWIQARRVPGIGKKIHGNVHSANTFTSYTFDKAWTLLDPSGQFYTRDIQIAQSDKTKPSDHKRNSREVATTH